MSLGFHAFTTPYQHLFPDARSCPGPVLKNPTLPYSQVDVIDSYLKLRGQGSQVLLSREKQRWLYCQAKKPRSGLAKPVCIPL